MKWYSRDLSAWFETELTDLAFHRFCHRLVLHKNKLWSWRVTSHAIHKAVTYVVLRYHTGTLYYIFIKETRFSIPKTFAAQETGGIIDDMLMIMYSVHLQTTGIASITIRPGNVNRTCEERLIPNNMHRMTAGQQKCAWNMTLVYSIQSIPRIEHLHSSEEIAFQREGHSWFKPQA